MPDNDSLQEFLGEAMRDFGAGVSMAEVPAIAMAGPVEKAAMGTLPGHEVKGIIARGGMGAVYLARQHALEREVAVKVMTAKADSAEMAERFRREALVLGKLAHPNIVPVYDVGTDDEGQLFYTMKLVKGRTLQHILHDLRVAGDARTAPVHSLASLLTVFRKACDAMAFAHSQGIIHRDLKPENIMVGEFGEVLVMDWGLAKMLNAAPPADVGLLSSSGPGHPSCTAPQGSFAHTLDGVVMGTPQYMSPEQARGEIDALDARSDIFSLGGILYAILTLRPPVEGKTLAEILAKVRTGSIEPPSTCGSAWGGHAPMAREGEVLEARKIKPLPHLPRGLVPSALSAVAMRALQLDKTRRYAQVADLSADLEAYHGGFATKAEAAGVARQVMLLVKRHAKLFSLAAAAAGIILALAVWFVINLKVEERRALAGEHAAVLEKEATREALAQTSLSLAEGWLREGDAGQMREALDKVPANLRDSTWRYLLGQSDTSVARLHGSTGAFDWGVPHPKLPSTFVLADSGGHISLIQLPEGKKLSEFKAALPGNGSMNLCLAVSPDGERVAVARRVAPGGIAIQRLSDGRVLGAWDSLQTEDLAFSPDGRLLLQRCSVRISQSAMYMWDVASGRRLWSIENNGGWVFGSFGRNGEMLVAQTGQKLRLVHALDGSLIQEFGEPQVATALAMREDGVFALQDSHRRVTIASLPDARVITRFQPATSLAAMDRPLLMWVPDGEQLAVAWTESDGRQVIQLRHAFTGSLLRSLLGGTQRMASAEIHPLSGELLVCSDKAEAWNVTGARPIWTQGLGAVGLAFLDEDDVIFSSATTAGGPNCALRRLRREGDVILWQPKTPYKHPSASADGRMLAIEPDNPALPFLVLRRVGGKMREVAAVHQARPGGSPRLSPDGGRLALLGPTLEVFATATGQKLPDLENAQSRRQADIAWLNRREIVGLVTLKPTGPTPRSEERIVVWDSDTGKVVRSIAHDSVMSVLAVAPDGSRFAEAGLDKMVRIRDAATLAVVQEFRAHDGPVSALAWHPRRPVLASASSDLAIRLWDLPSGRMLEELRGPINHPPGKLIFSPSGHRLGCATAEDLIRIWEPVSLRE